jgi:hypothetical protein
MGLESDASDRLVTSAPGSHAERTRADPQTNDLQDDEDDSVPQRHGVAGAAWTVSCKLVALRQILFDCGVIRAPVTDSTAVTPPVPVGSRHRVLVFAQFKALLDICERDLFPALYIKWLR